jgi:hypothetical protein
MPADVRFASHPIPAQRETSEVRPDFSGFFGICSAPPRQAALPGAALT